MRRTAPIVIFIVGQLASIAILVLWIVSHARSPVNVMWLLDGIFLMIPVIGAFTLIFIFWSKSRMLDTERANFIAGVSHELMTPLASLRLYTETLAIRDLSREKRAEFLELMLQDSDRLQRLISQILQASKLERGKALFSFRTLNAGELIEDYIEDHKVMLEGVDMELDLDGDCYCRIDRDSFNMMLKNLIENGIKYSAEPASIRVSLKKRRGKVHIRVADKGEGIDKKRLKKVFRLFYRVSRKAGGTGLGLFIVKMVVQAHKGKVWAESDGLGEGAVMNVLLPARAPGGEDAGADDLEMDRPQRAAAALLDRED